MKISEKLVEMVENPYAWYSQADFEKISAGPVCRAIQDDNHRLMALENKTPSFFGGYVIGYTLKEKMGASAVLGGKPKSYQYLNPLRVAQCLEIHPDDLPEVITPLKQKPKPLIQRYEVKGGYDYGIYVGSLAYLTLPVLVRKPLEDLEGRTLIEKFKVTGDRKYKDRFLEQLGDFVGIRINTRFQSNLGFHEFGALTEAGLEGLSKGVDLFDLEQDIKLETYFEFKVDGAILDYMRDNDSVPRLIRQTVKAINPFVDQMKSRGDEVDPEVLAELAETSTDNVKLALGVIDRGNGEVSIEETRYKHKTTGREVYLKDTDPALWVEDPAVAIEERDLLATLLSHLHPGEQEMINAYYLEGLTMKQVGEALGLSESRMSQDFPRVMQRLRDMGARMQSQWGE